MGPSGSALCARSATTLDSTSAAVAFGSDSASSRCASSGSSVTTPSVRSGASAV